QLYWAVGLFVATCLTTFMVGMGYANLTAEQLQQLQRIQAQQDPAETLRVLMPLIEGGLLYSGALMAILLAHEFGHYLQARRHGVYASFPFFIPMPFGPLGTMGAVILQRPGVADRRQMFDIAVSGPL